jgi:GAF domain-containing protein
MFLPMPGAPTLDTQLRQIGEHFDAQTGTLHVRGNDGWLNLAAAFGVPEWLRPTIERIPIGKGMAGLTAQRREPVTVCNLQTDGSGTARPDARTTGVEGAIAIPILDAGKLVGILGIGKPHAHTFTTAEIELLLRLGPGLKEELGYGTRRTR